MKKNLLTGALVTVALLAVQSTAFALPPGATAGAKPAARESRESDKMKEMKVAFGKAKIGDEVSLDAAANALKDTLLAKWDVGVIKSALKRNIEGVDMLKELTELSAALEKDPTDSHATAAVRGLIRAGSLETVTEEGNMLAKACVTLKSMKPSDAGAQKQLLLVEGLNRKIAKAVSNKGGSIAEITKTATEDTVSEVLFGEGKTYASLTKEQQKEVDETIKKLKTCKV